MYDLDTVDLTTLEAVLETDKGTMVLSFRPDLAPGHVRNFLDLAQKGFYDGTAFHRIIRGFMIQGGCPNTKEGASGTPGTGGPGHRVEAEFNEIHHERGVVSMARAQDPNSAGSQFFLVHGDAGFLDRQYTAFGNVVEGLDVLDEIASAEVEHGQSGEESSPVERVGLHRVSVRERAAVDGGGESTAGDGDDGGLS